MFICVSWLRIFSCLQVSLLPPSYFLPIVNHLEKLKELHFLVKVQLIFFVPITAVDQSDPVIHTYTFFFLYYLPSCYITRDWIQFPVLSSRFFFLKKRMRGKEWNRSRPRQKSRGADVNTQCNIPSSEVVSFLSPFITTCNLMYSKLH